MLVHPSATSSLSLVPRMALPPPCITVFQGTCLSAGCFLCDKGGLLCEIFLGGRGCPVQCAIINSSKLHGIIPARSVAFFSTQQKIYSCPSITFKSSNDHTTGYWLPCSVSTLKDPTRQCQTTSCLPCLPQYIVLSINRQEAGVERIVGHTS